MQYLRALLIPLFLVAGACSNLWSDYNRQQILHIFRHNHPSIPAGLFVYGNIESPAGAADGLTGIHDTAMNLSGWAIFVPPDDPIHQLDILLDGTQKATVKNFSLRPDVADAYGRPDFESCGWLATLSLTGTTPGRHVLLLHATSLSGKSSDFPPFVLNVQ